MQKAKLIPTPLFDASSKKPVVIAAARAPSAFRSLRIIAFVLGTAWLWWKTSFQLLFTGRSNTRAGARRIRLFLEEMGGLWVKAGQFMSMRRDLYRPETCDELTLLQDHATGFPFADVRRVVEEELGRPIEHVFSEFSEEPVAAASIGQTHVARLRHNGVRVAVKVQRPFVAQTFRRDLDYLKRVAAWLQQLGIAPQARWGEMVWELEKTLTEELDYRMEASSIGRSRKLLRAHKVYAPKVFYRYCSRRVLVMEFIEGVFMSEYIKAAEKDPARLARWIEENDITPKKVGERLFLMHLRQVFEDNLFHSDLHPGNIVLQRNNRFALIDFGSVGSMDKSRLQTFRMLIGSIAERDYVKVADFFLLQSPPLPNNKDIAALKADLVRMMRAWEAKTTIKNLPYHEKSMAALFGEFGKIMQRYSVAIAWDFLCLNRADATLDASLVFLCPEVDYIKLAKKYEKQSRARALRKASKPGALAKSLGNLTMAAQLPKLLAENVFFEADWIRRRAMGFEGRISKLATFAQSALSMASFGVTVLVGVMLGAYARLVLRPPAALDAWWVRELYAYLPVVKPQIWLVLAVVAFFFSRKLLQIRSFVQEKEYEHPGHAGR